jgi:hypothetical protein
LSKPDDAGSRSALWFIWGIRTSAVSSFTRLACEERPQLLKLAFEPARQNREPAPGLWVEVLVVQVERRRVAFSFPLIATPEPEEPLDPQAELLA